MSLDRSELAGESFEALSPDESELIARAEKVVAELSPREEKILRLRYGHLALAEPQLVDGKPRQRIEAEREWDREQIRKIEADALAKLRRKKPPQ